MKNLAIRLSVDGQAQVVVQLGQVDASVKRVGESARTAATGGEKLASAFARLGQYGSLAGAIAGLSVMGKAVFDASAAAQRLATQLNFATGGKSAAEMAFVSSMANRLGLELNSTAHAYAGFAAAARGTAIEGEKARSAFEAISMTAAVMGLSTDQARGALLAVQQMMSKGVVSAEEFRGQLGERVPIALQAGAKALGVTTAEFSRLLETGQIVTADFLPKFDAALRQMVGGAAEEAATRLDASVNRMANAWQRLKQSIGDSGVSAAMAQEARGLATEMDRTSSAFDRARKSGEGALGALAAAAGRQVLSTTFGLIGDAASLTNTALNRLSGGVLSLNENVSLLPLSVRTVAEQAQVLGSQLSTAEQELAALQKRSREAGGGSIYLRSEMADLERYIERLRQAKLARDNLMGGAGTGRGFINPPTAGETAAAAEQAQAAAADKVAAVRARLAKINPEYIKTLQDLAAAQAVLNAAATAGYSPAEVQAAAYTPANKAAKDAASGAREHAKAYADLGAKIAEHIAAVRHEISAGAELTEMDKLAAEAKKTLSGSQLAAMLTLIEYGKQLDINLELRKASIKAMEDEAKARADLLAKHDETIQAQAATIQGLEDELYGIENGKAALLERVLLREQERVAMIESEAVRALVERSDAAEYERLRMLASQMREVIDLRRQVAGATASAEASEANARAATDAARDWQRAADQIGQSLADALMQGGKSAAEYIKSLFRTMVLRPIIQAATAPFANAALGALGMGAPSGAAAAAQTGGGAESLLSSVGSLGSLAGSLGSLGTIAGTGFGLTMAGNTAGAMASAGAMMSGGSVASGMAMGLGALGPYALAALAAYMLYKKLDKSGTAHNGSVVGIDTAGAASTLWGDPSQITRNHNADTDAALAALGQSASGMLNALSRAAGGAGGYTSVLKYASDDTDPSIGGFNLSRAGQTLSDFGVYQGDFRKYDKDAQAGFEQYTRDVVAATRVTLDQIDLPNWAREQFRGLEQGADLQALASVADTVAQTMQALRGMESGLRDLGGVFAALAGQGSDALYQVAQLAGGMDALASSTSAYFGAFYTDAERAARSTQVMTDALSEVGLALPASREAFRAVVDGLDVATDAGRRQFVVMMQLAGSFDQVAKVAEAAAIETQRAAEAAAQEAQRLAEAALSRAQAVADERMALEERVLTLLGDTAELRARELARLDEGNRTLQTRVWALEDEQRAAEAAAQEAQRLAEESLARAQAVASEREQLEDRLLQAMGDTAELRARELARLDQSNRTLQERVWALEDEQQHLQALAGAGQGIAAFVRELLGVGRSASGSLAVARREYMADLGLAQRGDVDASSRITGSARDFVDALRANATDPVSFARETSRIATQLQALPATVAWQQQVLDNLAKVAAHTGAGGALAIAIGNAMAEARATITLTLDSALPEDLKQLALGITATVTRMVQFVADSTQLPADLRTLAAQTSSALLVTVQAALAADMPNDVRELALRTQHTLAVTVDAALAANVPDDVKRLALRATHELVTTVAAALSPTLPDDVRSLALRTQSTLAVTVQAALAADVSDDVKRLALRSISEHAVAVGAVLAADIDADAKRLALQASSAYLVTVNALLASTIPDDVKTVLLNASSTATRAVLLSATLADALTADQRAVLHASSETIRRIVEQVVNSPALTPEQWAVLDAVPATVVRTLQQVVAGEQLSEDQRTVLYALPGTVQRAIQQLVSSPALTAEQKAMLNALPGTVRQVVEQLVTSPVLTAEQRALLNAVPATVRRVIEQLPQGGVLTEDQRMLLQANAGTVRRVIEQILQSPTLTDEQRALLQAITGDVRTTLDIIVRSGEAILWDASDPLRSIFLGIKAAAENTAGLLQIEADRNAATANRNERNLSIWHDYLTGTRDMVLSDLWLGDDALAIVRAINELHYIQTGTFNAVHGMWRTIDHARMSAEAIANHTRGTKDLFDRVINGYDTVRTTVVS